MELANAQEQFTQIMHSLSPENHAVFLQWVDDYHDRQIYHSKEGGLELEGRGDDGGLNTSKQQSGMDYDENDDGLKNADIFLDHISSDIRETLPVNALYTSENIVFPVVGENADCDPKHTVHVDAFLYDEDVIDNLCDEGKMSRNYCTQCGSHDVKPLTFITHSSSRGQLNYIFSHLLPDLQGKVVLDVGSRLGAVLYGAYYFSAATQIVGVEINADLCQLQSDIVHKYKLNDRIQVINADICSQMQLIKQADVVILQNVFEFFAPLDVQTRIWQFLYQNLRRSGTVLVTSPGLSESLQHLETGINIKEWVEETDLSDVQKRATSQIYHTDEDGDEFDLGNLHLYTVR